MDIAELLNITVHKEASDLHLIAGQPPIIRVNGELIMLPQFSVLTAEFIEKLIFALMTVTQREVFLNEKELDFSYAHKEKETEEANRFRVNAYFQHNTPAASLRFIPNRIRTFEELNLPKPLEAFSTLQQGFILVTGPTGQGKSTTIATIINEINLKRKCHIVTIEDPIEYTYPKGKALISQRELKVDTFSWQNALRSVLREDPDVVLVGEMRDQETISSALTIAETGHLVFSTLHTNSASQTIDRIIDVFPEHQQGQIRQQLATTLSGVLSQRLVPAISGGRIPALELLLSTAAVRTSIRDAKTHLIDNIIQTSKEVGMISLEEYFSNLVLTGKVSLEVAEKYVLRPSELRRFLKH